MDRNLIVFAGTGAVRTPLNPADNSPGQIGRFGRGTDMKRAAHPVELSPDFVFLASPVCSGCITGIVLPVTGSVGAAWALRSENPQSQWAFS